MGILGSGTENIEIGVVSSSVPDEAAKCLDSFPGAVSGTVGQFERTPEFLSPLFSLCARSSSRIERWSPEPKVTGSNPVGRTILSLVFSVGCSRP